MSNNIINYLKKPDIIRIIHLLEGDEKHIYERSSLFEIFDAWERLIPLAVGHGEVCTYGDLLSLYGEHRLKYGEYSRAASCSRWRCLNRLDVMDQASVASKSEPQKNVVSGDRIEVDLNNIVSNNIKKAKSFAELSSVVRKELEKCKSIEFTVTYHITCDEFLRPDPHSAAVAFDSWKYNENYNSSEYNLLMSQLLVELLIAYKESAGVRVSLCIEGEYKASFGLINYLFDRKLFYGNADVRLYAGSDDETIDQFADEALKVRERIRIRPRVRLSDRDEIWLLKAISRYPIGAFAFDGDGMGALNRVLTTVCDSTAHSRFISETVLLSKNKSISG